MMNRRQFLIASGSVATLPSIAFAQASVRPTDSATILVGFSAGGAGDLAARVAAEFAKQNRSYPVGVEFRPGAGGTIATDQVRRAPPDGTTLSLYSVSPILVAPQIQKLPYDPLSDFTYIASFANTAIPAFVHADSPLRSWEKLLAFAKANPGKLRWATAAPRGMAHISTETAFRQEGVTAAFVPFSGGTDAITALLGGHIDMVVAADFAPHLNAGKVRLLAESGPEPIKGHPDVPTFKQLGYPLSIASSYGLFGPSGLAKPVVSFWEQTTRDMIGTELYQKFLTTLGGQEFFQDSATLSDTVKSNFAVIGKQIELLGFTK